MFISFHAIMIESRTPSESKTASAKTDLYMIYRSHSRSF